MLLSIFVVEPRPLLVVESEGLSICLVIDNSRYGLCEQFQNICTLVIFSIGVYLGQLSSKVKTIASFTFKYKIQI